MQEEGDEDREGGRNEREECCETRREEISLEEIAEIVEREERRAKRMREWDGLAEGE